MREHFTQPAQPAATDKPSPYRADIDVLRALSVILVILYHTQIPLFSGGFVGVDVFFIISGFLITSIITSKVKQQSFKFRDFVISRVKRIFPALFVLLCIVAVICSVVPLYWDKFDELRRSIRSASLFWSNIYFYMNTGYFDTPAIDQIVLHTWSLGVEVQFYLIYPFFLIFLIKFCKDKLHLALLISTIAFFVFSVFFVHFNAKGAFYLFPSRSWEFLLGGWLAVSQFSFSSQRSKKMLIYAGIALIFIPSFVYNNLFFPTFPGLWALPPCLGATLYIAGGTNLAPNSRTFLLTHNRALVHIGLISYSLYLYHWPVLVISRKLSFDSTIPFWILAPLFILIWLLAHLSWKYVEQPARYKMAACSGKKYAVALTCCLLLIIGWTKVVRAPLPIFSSSYLSQPAGEKFPSAFSVIGDPAAPPSFALWGDSHAQVFSTLLDQLGRENAVSGRYLASDGNLINAYRARAIDNDEINDALHEYPTKERYKYVFLINRWALGLKGYLPSESQEPSLDEIGLIYTNGEERLYGAAALEKALNDTISYLEDNGAEKIYILLPIPECASQIPQAANMLNIFTNESGINQRLGVNHADYSKRNAEVLQIMKKVSQRFSSVILLDPYPILFPSENHGKSIVVSNGKPLYFDDDHLSSAGVPLLKEIFQNTEVFSKE